MKWTKFTNLILACLVLTSGILLKKKEKQIARMEEQEEKIMLYYRMLNMWLEMKQKGKSAVTFLQEKKIKRIAIYGMKELGERIYEEVKNTEIEVACIIDKKPDSVFGNFKVISPDQEIPDVDAIIVTADYYYWDIRRKLEKKVHCPVYSLNGILGNSFGRNL